MLSSLAAEAFPGLMVVGSSEASAESTSAFSSVTPNGISPQPWGSIVWCGAE